MRRLMLLIISLVLPICGFAHDAKQAMHHKKMCTSEYTYYKCEQKWTCKPVSKSELIRSNK